jgi:cytochrome c oxidase accessory protein FixG
MMTGEPPSSASLYASEAKIQPRMAHGRYAKLRVASMLALLGLYYLLPWLTWNDNPLVLLDLPARRFHVFGLTLVPQDLTLLSALLAVAAMTLFFFTTLAGRLWCGYACPQTVWTVAFLWIERAIEGERHQRIKLDQSPWNLHKIAVRGAKHLAWLTFALWTGITFVGFFVPIREFVSDAVHLQLGGWSLFWALFYGFATWGNAGFMREQVCKYMCPYARFQSAMFDKDTLIIAYDEKRGEPRKSRARKAERGGVVALSELPNAAANKVGDCIDCTLCVQVCPTGIDIRQGLQYECIACAACVDICNDVMDKVGKPRGLIRYTSESHDQGGDYRVLRPRSIGYGVIWLALLGAFAALVLLRSPLELDVLRDRKQLYRELADGRIANLYTIKLTNKSEQTHTFTISAMTASGHPVTIEPSQIEVAAEQTGSELVAAILPKELATGVQALRFEVRAVDAPDITRGHEARFIGGSP